MHAGTGLADQQCGDLRFVIIDAERMPFIARNISTAWEAGKPGVLTKHRAAEAANRGGPKLVRMTTQPSVTVDLDIEIDYGQVYIYSVAP